MLIITYYWPPAGGPGVQRWLKFVKYLPEFEIEPIVYIPENPSYPLIDATLLEEVSEKLTVLKQPIFEPYGIAGMLSKKQTKIISSGIISPKKKQSLLQKLLLYVRGNFFVPDARKFWIKPSVRFLKSYIEANDIETIITTGPPHSVHLIGMKLKELLGVRWFADFRDPWTTIGYHKKLKLGKRAKQKHRRLEKDVLNQSDHIIVTSFTTKKEFETLTEQPITVITNGYDTTTIPSVSLDVDFTISHIGSLLAGRNPKMFWKAIADLIQENSAFAERLSIQLVGAVSTTVLESIRSFGLDKYLKIQGYVSHLEALELQRKAQLLLLIEIDSPETRCIIPGKLFEYMNAKRPILAFGPQGSDVAQVLQTTETGTYFTYTEYAAIKAQLQAYFDAYQDKILIAEGRNIVRYSRKNLTASLATLLKS